MDLDTRLKRLRNLDVGAPDGVDSLVRRAHRRGKRRRGTVGAVLGTTAVLALGILLTREPGDEQVDVDGPASESLTASPWEAPSGLPDGLPLLTDASVAGDEEHLAVVGGETEGGSASSVVAVYTRRAGTWQLFELPEPRLSSAAAFVGGRLVVWGGGPGGTDSPSASSSGWVLELATGEWTSLPASPLSPRMVPAVGASGSRLLLWGGFTASPDDGGTQLADGAVLDLATSEWTALPAVAVQRPAAAGVWVGETLVVVELLGEGDGTKLELRGFDSAGEAQFETRWPVTLGPADHGNQLFVLTSVEGTLVVVADYVRRASLSAGEVMPGSPSVGFDVVTREWIDLDPLPMPTSICAAGAPNGGAVVHCNNGGAILDPGTAAWRAVPVPSASVVAVGSGAGVAYAVLYHPPVMVGDQQDVGGPSGTVIAQGSNELVLLDAVDTAWVPTPR